MRMYSHDIGAAATRSRESNDARAANGVRQRLLNLGAPPQLLADIERTQRSADYLHPVGAARRRRDGAQCRARGSEVAPGEVMFRDRRSFDRLGDGRCRRTRPCRRRGRPAGHGARAQLPGPELSRQGRPGLPAHESATRTVKVRIELTNRAIRFSSRTCMPKPRSTPAAAMRCWRCPTAPSSIAASARWCSSIAARGGLNPAPFASAGLARLCGDARWREGGEAVVTSANFLIDAESNLRIGAQVAYRRGGGAMIERLIAVSARNLMLVLIATVFAAGWALRVSAYAARCAARSLRYASHRLHRISRAGAAGGRGSGHLSADDGDARRAAVAKWCAAFRIFGVSFVYVIFEDGTDLYWARSRVLEYLNAATGGCPTA